MFILRCGILFCSAGGSGDFATAPSLSVTEQITQAKERIRRKSNCKKFIAYFQAYTNTYAPVSYLRELFYGGDRTAGYCCTLHRNTL